MKQSLATQSIVLERKKKIAKLEQTIARTSTPSVVLALKNAILDMKDELQFFEKCDYIQEKIQ